MQWTDDKQIHIHTVLHQNKNDEHARGHIGTELNNKAETILQVEVDKEDKAISVVEAVHIRDQDFEPFAFRRSIRRGRFLSLYIVLQWMPLLPMAISAVMMITWNV